MPSRSNDHAHRAKSVAGITWGEVLFQGVVLLVLLAVLFPAVLRGETLLPGGLLYEFAPWRAHVPKGIERVTNETLIEAFILYYTFHDQTERALHEGEWPLWNPLEFAGMPLLANYQSAVFYPPRLLHVLLELPIATTVFVLLKLWLCGMTAYGCARCFRLSAGAARFASVGWMLSGYNVVWANRCDPDVAAWLPVLLIAAELILDGRYRRGFCAMAFAGTLMLLAGHPESAFTMSVGVGAYFCVRLVLARRWGRPLAMSLGVAGGAWAVALLATSVQTLPFLEYLRNSYTYLHRQSDLASRHFVPGGAAVAFWTPRFYGTNSDQNFWASSVPNADFIGMLYAGISVWLAAMLVFVRSERPKGEIVRMVALAIPGAMGVLLAFDAPFLRAIQGLPVMSATWGCWYMGFPMFALVLLGAMGLERWSSKPRRPRELAAPALCGLAAAAYVGGVFHLFAGLMRASHVYDYVAHQVALAAVLGGAALAILLAYCFWPRPKALVPFMTVLLAAELVIAGQGYHGSSPRSQLFPQTPLTQYLKELGSLEGAPARVSLTSALIPTGLIQAYGIEELSGYDDVLPERMYLFMGRLSGTPWWNVEPLCATRYYLHDPACRATFPKDDPGRFSLVTTLDGIEVYENLRAFPRAFLVGALEALADADALFDRMRAPDFDPGSAALTEAGFGVSPLSGGRTEVASSGTPGSAKVTSRTGTRVALDVDANGESVLVLADAYYPGWKAFVDGNAARVFPAYYAFRGVRLGAGTHRVEFRYEPLSFRIGLMISVATLLLSALVGVCAILRRARRMS